MNYSEIKKLQNKSLAKISESTVMECTLSSGKLPPGLLVNCVSVNMITDHPNMSSTVYPGHKSINQTKTNKQQMQQIN